MFDIFLYSCLHRHPMESLTTQHLFTTTILTRYVRIRYNDTVNLCAKRRVIYTKLSQDLHYI